MSAWCPRSAFAEFGHHVKCVDKNGARIAELNAGKLSIYEPGLETAVAENWRAGRLSFSTDLAGAVAGSDAVFIAVGTPARAGDGHADLSFVYAVAREIAPALCGYTVVVTKSTVPVGTGDAVEAIIRELRPDADFATVSNPEFLREGSAIDEFKRPNRIVVGSLDERARDVMRAIYRPLYLNQAPMLFTDRRTAEMIKYASNAFLATKVAFINEMADLCEKTGANVQDVARGMGLDNRIGAKFLHPGPGFGGSCFPKDLAALLNMADANGVRLGIAERRERRQSRAASAPWWDASSRRSTAASPARPSPSSASPSSRTPTTCARRRRWSLVPDLQAAGRPSAPSIRRAWTRRDRSSPAPSSPPTPTIAPPAPTRSSWSPSGRSFRALDLAELRARMKQPVRHRPPQHLSARRNPCARLHLPLDRPLDAGRRGAGREGDGVGRNRRSRIPPTSAKAPAREVGGIRPPRYSALL